MTDSNIDISNLTFKELWLEYSNFIKLKLKPQSYRKECSNYKNHILPFFQDYLVKDIDAKVYVQWMLEIEKQGFKHSFNSNLHTYMVSILNYAVKFKDLKSNVASKVGTFTKKKNEPKNVDFWVIEEFLKFTSVIDDNLYKILFNILYFTGLRIGECLALTWNDFKDDYLDINKTISKEKDKNGNYIISTPKTSTSIRKIKLDSQLITMLEEYYKQEKQLKDFKDTWFILGGLKPLSHTTVTRNKNRYCELAKVKKIRLHDFRHSHATLLLSNGIPITVISQRLGHSEIAITLNTYSHLVFKDEERAIDLINSIKSNYALK